MRLRAYDFEIEFTLDEVRQGVKIVDEVLDAFIPDVLERKKPAMCVCGHGGHMHDGHSREDRLADSPLSGKCLYDTCSCEEFRDRSGP